MNNTIPDIDKKKSELSQSPGQVSKQYARFYAFFLIPLMIVMFAGLLYFLTRGLVYEKSTVQDLLKKVETGSQATQWQSALELAKRTDEIHDLDDGDKLDFYTTLSRLYKISKDDLKQCYDDRRIYLASTMGALEDSYFAINLLDGLNDECDETACIEGKINIINRFNSRVIAITCLGQLDYSNNPALSLEVIGKLVEIIKSNHTDISENEIVNVLKLHSIIALGEIGNIESKDLLLEILKKEEWSELKDGEGTGLIPINIKWNAAVALAKIGIKDELVISNIKNLLSRNYYSNYESTIDSYEIDHTILVLLDIIKIYQHPDFKNILKKLENDTNKDISKKAKQIYNEFYKNS